jgi:long-subunit acyl-CoA synthetase (AMP-forming)
MTETSLGVALNTRRRGKAGSVGKPLAGAQVRIVMMPAPSSQRVRLVMNLGQGAMVTQATTNLATRRPPRSRRYGFFRTGDLGMMDDEALLAPDPVARRI